MRNFTLPQAGGRRTTAQTLPLAQSIRLLFEQGNRFSCPDRPSGAAAFDTYAAAKLLGEAGFDGKRAEAAVAVVSDAVGHGRRRRQGRQPPRAA